jgi:RimJ/RimL family protein N-acetyltransferase
MANQEEPPTALRHHREQMLRLVAKSFYNELINYGVDTHEILTVAEHLLDSLRHKGDRPNRDAEYYSNLFTIKDVQDQWTKAKRLTMQRVSICPIDAGRIPQIAAWLREPAIRESFYPSFPDSAESLSAYFQVSSRDYFSIFYDQDLAGIIGAENLDPESEKLEMRKLVGDPRMHGKGIGKRATFLFLYHVFLIRKFRKVYLHSMDINIRNINLNSKFGFELEGVFLEDARIHEKWQDVLRMSVSGSLWLKLFS